MKYLVLGSEGQIGKPLCEYLLDKGHDVDGIDIVNGYEEDLRERRYKLYKRFRDSDFVYFLAFDVGGSRYLKEYEHTIGFLSNNSKIMSSAFGILDACKKPFVFASSQMS